MGRKRAMKDQDGRGDGKDRIEIAGRNLKIREEKN